MTRRALAEPGESWIAAKLTGARFYYGKLCEKHPESGGLRYSPAGNCVMCARERSIRQGKARVSAKQEVEQ